MYNPFETRQIEEFIPSEYEEYMDHFRLNIIPDVTKDTVCPKCGQTITEFELDINNDICPCCGTYLSEDYIII
mgnify:CR=1 FL=1